MKTAASHKVKNLSGEITVPGDKSISHRSLILGSQAIGKTTVSGLLEGEDVLHTAEALRQMGVVINRISETEYEIFGLGTGGLQHSEKALYLGNSGTGARLLMGLVAPYKFKTEFEGDASLSKRPMMRVLTPLKQMGAVVETAEGGCLPLSIQASPIMIPINYSLPIASAQVKSAIILSALNIAGITEVIEKERTRDHTEKMLNFMGADVQSVQADEGWKISISGQPELKPVHFNVPADPSSAAFLIAAALLVEGSKLKISNVCINPLRIGLFDTLLEMGAKIKYSNKRMECGENVADIEVEHSKLRGVNVPAERAPSMIDEYPILAVIASFAEGETVMNGLKELRVKESDRLQAIADGLQENSVKCEIDGDNLQVFGGEVHGGGVVKTHMDHRIAMSFLIMGMASSQPVKVDDVGMIATSFPNFIELINKIGGKVA